MGRRLALMLALAMLGLSPAAALDAATVQCPGDTDGDAVPDEVDPAHPFVKCAHLSAGDGFIRMGDGTPMYIFGYSDLTGVAAAEAAAAGLLAANFSAPTLSIEEGQEFYLTLTNVGFIKRPDLFDPHSIHYHGFPQASSIFDGVPESSLVPNQGASFTYYYNVLDPGTYIYHCHVEAAEHMQMGMLGNLFVRPAQDRLPDGADLSGFTHRTGNRYAYNDNDGSTRYDVEYPLQISSFDPDFHNASETVQPLPFALMEDRYAMLNGRGYPDTVNPAELPEMEENNWKRSQKVSSLVEATQGQRVLLRISNVSITRFFTLGSMGFRFRVVGKDARQLRGPGGADLSYSTSSITLGGGETADAIIDTASMSPGTYFLYTTNLHFLNNDEEDFGGIMTEVVIKPAI